VLVVRGLKPRTRHELPKGINRIVYMLSVKDIIDSGANVTLAVSAKDLRDFAREVVAEAKHEMEAAIAENKSEAYYTREQVMSICSVSLRTVQRWEKEDGGKYLPPIRIGHGLIRYRRSDVEKILNKNQ
jgi:DNA-binding XRE family transcriptional regulator